MKFEGLLPIGSVVLLKDSTRKVMIIGVGQYLVKEDGVRSLYDYAGCVYPEGYLSADKNFLFNDEQIERVYSMGYMDEESFAFQERAAQVITKLRAEEQ